MRQRLLCLAALAFAACSSGPDALVVVTVTTDSMVPGIASLHGTVTAKGKTAPVDVVDQTGDFFSDRTSLTFALQIPAAYAGPISVTVEARDAQGNVVGSGSASGDAVGGKRTTMTVALALTAACDGDAGACGDMANPCNPGFHPCNGTCVDDTLTSSCGTSCDPCPAPPNSTQVACVSGACTFSCAGGFKKCGMQCIATTDCCATDCPPVTNGTPICTSNACDVSCDSGFKPCNGACIPTAGCCGDTDCAPVTNGVVTCGTTTDHMCHLTCNAGTVPSGGMCDVAPPRLLSPISDSRVSSRQPKMQVVLAASTDDALIDVCDDATCAHTPVATFLASAGSPSLALPARKTLWWRAHGKKSGVVGTAATGTWEFVTPNTSATNNTAVSIYADVNGDGYADVIAGAPAAKQVYVYLGSSVGVHTTPDATLKPPSGGTSFGVSVAAGDLDGDGIAEVLVGATAQLFVWKGGSTLFTANQPPMATINGPSSSGYGNSIAALGDYNGDGYGDFAVGAASTNAVYIYAGSGAGITNDQTALHTLAAPSMKSFGNIAGPGDVNCDGYGDLIIGGGNDDIFLHVGKPDASYTGAVTETTGPAGSGFGLRLAGAGDLNNDGCADVAVGESAFATTHQGFVALGGTSGLGSASAISDPGSTTNFGVYTVGAGNIGGSDNGSVIVSSSASLYVYVGPPPMTLRTTITLPTTAAGAPMGSAGDTNNDGYEDSFAVQGTSLVLFHGSASGFGTTKTAASVTVPSPLGAPVGGVVMRVQRAWVELASLFLPRRR